MLGICWWRPMMVMAQDLKLDNQSLGTLTLYHLKVTFESLFWAVMFQACSYTTMTGLASEVSESGHCFWLTKVWHTYLWQCYGFSCSGTQGRGPLYVKAGRRAWQLVASQVKHTQCNNVATYNGRLAFARQTQTDALQFNFLPMNSWI